MKKVVFPKNVTPVTTYQAFKGKGPQYWYHDGPANVAFDDRKIAGLKKVPFFDAFKWKTEPLILRGVKSMNGSPHAFSYTENFDAVPTATFVEATVKWATTQIAVEANNAHNEIWEKLQEVYTNSSDGINGLDHYVKEEIPKIVAGLVPKVVGSKEIQELLSTQASVQSELKRLQLENAQLRESQAANAKMIKALEERLAKLEGQQGSNPMAST